MTLVELKQLFRKEITSMYSENEINELYTIFCSHFFQLSRMELRNHDEKKLSETQVNEFKNAIKELKTGRPFQQILGETEFYELKFYVDENVLIPRPETEELLELAIQKIQSSTFKAHGLKFLDIGTGSGIIPVVLKKKFPEAEITAIDFSEKALVMAKKNADYHQTDIEFIHQDYLNSNLTEVYDVIISNPPYIGMDEEIEIEDSVKGFEPIMALFSPTSDALIFYEKIAKDCKNHLSENGMLFLEINQKLGLETQDVFVSVLSKVDLLKDLSGNDRFVWGRK